MITVLVPLVAAALTLLGASVASAFDDCSGALPVGSADSSFSDFSLAGYTDGVGDPIRPCTGEPGHNNVWGTFTPTADGVMTITGNGSVSIYSGTCGALTSVLCHLPNDTDSVPLTGGQTYYLELSSPPMSLSYLAVFCGDGHVGSGQACDDGNQIDEDACTNACALNVCGDGSLYTGVEECDDGNLDDTDACTADCTIAVCGDGSLQTGVEECDDGNVVNGDGCESCVMVAVCGNGVPEAGEECDDGNASNADACVAGCLDNVCGDGFVNTGVEQCDDGNLVDGDGCESCTTTTNDHCTAATPYPPPPAILFVDLTGATTDPGDPLRTCTLQQGEHNRWFTYTVPPDVSGRLLLTTNKVVSLYSGSCGALVEIGCQASALPPATPFPIDVTGGQTYYIELSGSESGSALFASVCGNNVVDFPTETCDDGNAIDTDGCSNICRTAACGDGTVQDGEQCDDGNLDNGDGCEDDCFETSVCGDNDVQGHETCDDGNLIDDDGCDADCRLPCPDNLCKCLGAASQFTAVGGKLGVANGKISGGGEPTEFYPTEIESSVCGTSGTFNAKPNGESDLGGDLVLTATAGYAGVFKSYKENNVLQPGTFVLGDLATGGGLVKGGGLTVEVDGATDTSGTHSLVAECTQAKLDITSAGATLAALAPTQTIASLVVESDGEHVVEVGPGRQVLSIPSIYVGGYSAAVNAAILTFQMDPATDVLIINVAKLQLGRGAEILVDDNGSGARAIVNIVPDGKVTLKDDASIEAPLLAPTANITLHGAFVGGAYTTKTMKLQGALLYDTLECEEE